MAKKDTALVTAPSEEVLDELRASYPVEESHTRTRFPRLGLFSQDVVEGKGKAMKVVTEAGTFFTERMTGEEDENGKKVFEKTELGDAIDGIILYERKQLRYYDKDTNTFTNSPVFDGNDEVVPLFSNKAEVDRGTPAELKAKYPGVTLKGKPKSNLEDVRVLYVLYEGELYQMDIRGTSAYSFSDYKKKVQNPSIYLTAFGSEPMENGSTRWNKMIFEVGRPISAAEAKVVVDHVRSIKEAIAQEKAHFAAQAAALEAQPLAAEFAPKRLGTK